MKIFEKEEESRGIWCEWKLVESTTLQARSRKDPQFLSGSTEPSFAKGFIATVCKD